MCGIVGAVSKRDISGVLLEGLKRLEYRGYDSAGMAVVNSTGGLERRRCAGKVNVLAESLEESAITGNIGIAHTRWATHGKPSTENAHPHVAGDRIALVHNGIIENYEEIREALQKEGADFGSDTDSEVIAHLIASKLKGSANLMDAVKKSTQALTGAYALAVIDKTNSDEIIVARAGSPLVIGVGIGENFIGSDALALQPVTNRFIFLEEGQFASLSTKKIQITDKSGKEIEPEIVELNERQGGVNKGDYRHYMEKEIFEQPASVSATLEGRISDGKVLENIFGIGSVKLFKEVKNIQIIACGTSFHAGLVAKYWIESIAGLPCQVEVASEFRYREKIVLPNTLFLSISQSGETADTLAALREADDKNYLGSLVICNVYGSSLVRESDLSLMTNAGPEIGVASTKAFTTQLVALMLLVITLAKYNGLDEAKEKQYVGELKSLSNHLKEILKLNSEIEALAKHFAEKHHALFLGRGTQYPVAMEGALKLKEISYIHAESYPAGELKHGPLALVDSDMPVITVAPNNELYEKLKSNLQEVASRGGELFIFVDQSLNLKSHDNAHIINMPSVPDLLAAIVYTVPLQLLSYHVALIKGTDVDQPRNLAKSVTVE